MGRHRNSDRHDHRAYCTGNQEVVDDGTTASPYPSSLLFWLKLHLKLIEPVNDPFYTPTHPPAA